VLAFSSFSPTEVTQKQLEYSFWSDVQILDAADKTEREEEERHKQLYRFLPQTGSSHVPIALPRRVQYNVISDYKCSLLNLAKDFKCSRTTARDFLCSWTQSRDFYSCNSCNVQYAPFVWHFRLGHLSNNRLYNMHHLYPNITCYNKAMCDICHFAKQIKLPYNISSSHTSLWQKRFPFYCLCSWS